MKGLDWKDVSLPAAPPFATGALMGYLAIVGGPAGSIHRGMPAIPPPAWSEGAAAASRLFRLDEDHCFHTPPHVWSNFHEPQITRGFAHFLGMGPPSLRRGRALAFMRAAALCAGRTFGETDLDGATFRCIAEENRTDVLLECRTNGGRFGVSLEAKFGHRLTRGQLPRAMAHARDGCGWNLDRSVFLVVAPDADALNGPVMHANRRNGWVPTSWWNLLDLLEREMRPAFDCMDYRRFRRTVWHRAY